MGAHWGLGRQDNALAPPLDKKCYELVAQLIIP